MTTRLKLYEHAPQAATGWEEPAPLDPACTKCELHEGARTVCMKPEANHGGVGGVLFVSEMPGKHEDSVGRPFAGPSGKYLRGLVAKHAPGVPVVFDNAVRCAPGARETKEAHVAACRPHTAQVLRAARPTRVVALGGWGALAVLGRKPPVTHVRRGHGWWIDEALWPAPEAWVPVFFTVNPAAALRNRFVARDFESDLAWALTCEPPKPAAWGATSTLVEDAATAEAACELLRAAEWFAFDTETSGVMHDRDFRVETLTAYPRGARHGLTWDRAALEDEATCAPLRELLRDEAVRKVGHNLKYDALAVWCDPALGVFLGEGMHADTRLYRKLLEGEVSGKLEDAAEVVGMGGHKEEAQAEVDAIKRDLAKLAGAPHRPPLKSGKARKAPDPLALKRNAGAGVVVPQEALDKIWAGRAEPIQYAYRYLAPAVRQRYNARDALSTALLMEASEGRLAAQANLTRVWRGVMAPAMRVLTRVEKRGIRADRGAIDQFEAYLQAKIDQVEARLGAYGQINYDSPVQLRALLFDRLGLPRVKKTDSGLDSTDGGVLEALEGRHPIIADILENRRLKTLRNRYATGMRGFVRDDGCLHTTFLLDGAGTGRMSSADPNLQNIPRPKDAKGNTEGKMARDIFVARPGYVLLELDFSQLELRVAAAIAQDPVMIAMFKSGVDFHTATARLICKIAWGIEQAAWDAMTEEAQDPYRSATKSVNFGVHYGKTAAGLARDLGCKVHEAQTILDAILGQFKVLKRTMDRTKEAAKKNGGVFAYWDGQPANWRPLYAVADQGEEASGRRNNAENAAWNTPVQGTAAHFCTASLHPVQRAWDEEGLDAHIALTVHDSILGEVRADQVDEAEALGRGVMTSWNSMGVPLVVDAKAGDRWGSLARRKRAA